MLFTWAVLLLFSTAAVVLCFIWSLSRHLSNTKVVSKIDDDVVATVANTTAKGKPQSFGKK